jgi:hypothetical protein
MVAESKAKQLAKPFNAEGLVRRLKNDEGSALQEWGGILKKANSGDAKAIERFEEVCQLHPAMNDWLVDCYTNQIPGQILDDLFSRGGMGISVLKQHVRKIADDLAGTNPTPIERMLADRAALCWLQAFRCDWQEGHAYQGGSHSRARLFTFRQSHAHKNFLSACKAIADVRKSLLVAIQVNAGNRPVEGS